MAVLKKSVSLDETVAERIQRAADDAGESFSLWLTNAAERQLIINDGLKAVAEWEAEQETPLTPEEEAAAQASLECLVPQARNLRASRTAAA